MEHSSQAINRYIVRVKVRTGFNVTTYEVGRTGLLHRYFSARAPDEEYTHYRIEFDSLKDLIVSRPWRSCERSQVATKNKPHE